MSSSVLGDKTSYAVLMLVCVEDCARFKAVQCEFWFESILCLQPVARARRSSVRSLVV
jgi:hypothetical protein